MDAVAFVKKKRRMCDEYPACVGCPLGKFGDCEDAKPEELVKVVEGWSKEHPLKTNGMKVWELIPGNVRSTNYYPADENALPEFIKGSEYVELIIRQSWWDDEYEED